MEYRDQKVWHEKKSDREREFEILRIYCEAKGFSGQMMLPGWGWDAEIMKGRVIGIGEVKWRGNGFGKIYPDYTIDVWKLEGMWAEIERRAKRGRELKAVLIISFLGDIRSAVVGRGYYSVSEQRRKDRIEKADKVYHVPWGMFRGVV